MNARRLLACASAAGAVLALSACEKPVPIVTVVSGGQSVYTEASSWCFEDQTPPDCAERSTARPSLAVRSGEVVGVDVDRELAERGWYIELANPAEEGEPGRSQVQQGHYSTFRFELPATGSLQLQVRAVGEGEEPHGTWQFTLRPKDRAVSP